MRTKSRRNRGGWPSRERHALVLRIDPALAHWLAEAAAKTGKSRARLIEGWLASLREVVDQSEHWKDQGLAPFDAVEVVGTNLVGELIRNGFGTDFLGEAWRWHLGEMPEQNALRKAGKS